MKSIICLFCLATLFSCGEEKEKAIENLEDGA
jgi:hypothetical protein